MSNKMISFFTLLCILLLTACNGDEVENYTLSLSESEISFTKAEETKSVTVTTNSKEWEATPTEEWIMVTQEGSKLNITVKENITTDIRTGYILVTAGQIKKIKIIQSASDASIVAIPGMMEVDQWGGKFTFDVNANQSGWSVKTTADWLKATARNYKNDVVLEIDENVERTDRIADIILLDEKGNEAQKFKLTQKGILYFVLPLLDFEADMDKIAAFEAQRRSKVVQQPTSDVDPYYVFAIKSPVFSYVNYYMIKFKYVQAFVYATEGSDILSKERRPELLQFLKDNGFTKELTTGVKFLDEKRHITVTINATGSMPNLQFIFEDPQIDAYPTFSKMRYEYSEGLQTAKVEDIMKWESENGGVFNRVWNDGGENDDDLYGFNTVEDPDFKARYYFVNKKLGIMTSIMCETNTPSTIFWKDSRGQARVTNEFINMLKKNGFSYDTYIEQAQTHVYVSKSKGLSIGVGYAPSEEEGASFEDGVAQYYLFPYSSTVAAPRNIVSQLKARKAAYYKQIMKMKRLAQNKRR